MSDCELGILTGAYSFLRTQHVTPRGEEAEMKRRTSIRSLKNRPGSVVIRRHGKVFVINRANPRWKTRQG
jgi:large subunit ribosomal protein L36